MPADKEAQAAGALNHPNILAVHDVGSHESAPYVVSELLEGETLRESFAAGALSQRKAVGYATMIAHGLSAAHEKGIIHRDLKPENIFITRDDQALSANRLIKEILNSHPMTVASHLDA